MKNTILFIIIFVFISISVSAQSRRTIRDLGIKSVNSEQTDFNGATNETIKRAYTSYDKKGNILIDIEYNPDSTFKKKEVNEYTIHSDIKRNTVFDSYGKVKAISIFNYDNFGNKTEEILMDSSQKIIERTIYSYNGFGQKTNETIYDANHKIKKRIEYKYDNHGAVTEKKVFNATMELISMRKFTYNY